MVPRIFNGLDQFIYNMFGRRQIRIPHAQIDNILSPSSCVYLQLIHDAEDIWRKPHHPMKSQTLGTKWFHAYFLSKQYTYQSPLPPFNKGGKGGIFHSTINILFLSFQLLSSPEPCRVQGFSQYWPAPVFPSTASSTYSLRSNGRGKSVPDPLE